MAPPMENFPLPIELREEIYSYLLGPGTTRDASWHEIDCEPIHVPGFHTAILGVNKHISADAAAYFGRANSFVRVNSRSQALWNHFDMMDIHICSKVKVDLEETPCVSYTIEISGPDDFFHGRGGLVDPQMSAVIREHDISKLWTIFSMGNHAPPSDRVHIRSGRDQKLKLATCSQEGQATPTVTVWAQENKYVHISADHKAAFLGSACAAFGVFFDASFHGFSDRFAPLRTSASTIIWPLAFEWHKFDALLALKMEADRLALAGKWNQALALYRYGDDFAKDWLDWIRPDLEYRVREFAPLVWHAMCALQDDLTFSVALVCFRRGVLTPSKHFVHARLTSRIQHFLAITRLYSIDGDWAPDRLVNSIESLKALPPNAEILHDIDHLQGVLQAKIPRDVFGGFNGVFSFDIFPFKTVNTVPDNGRQLYGRPDGLVGLQDTIHLARFTKEDKEAVVLFQKEHGLRVTDFEVDGSKRAEGSLNRKNQDGEKKQD